MAAMAGILNHQMTAGQALAGTSANLMASTATGSSGLSDSSSSSAAISANDFLTLLVTEMQNQDPTANTDPNEYINQLVSVNSLEQLIDINQNLSTAMGDSSTGSGSSTQAAASPASVAGGSKSATAAARPAASVAAAAGGLNARPIGIQQSPGNLSAPAASPAASRIAHALDGRPCAQSHAGGLSGAR
jgi:flagellar basal-body rod modification protein FlgD